MNKPWLLPVALTILAHLVSVGCIGHPAIVSRPLRTAETPENPSLVVTVVDARRGGPFPGVLVSVRPRIRSADREEFVRVTDSRGRATFHDISADTDYTIKITLSGYRKQSARITTPGAGGRRVVFFTMREEGVIPLQEPSPESQGAGRSAAVTVKG